MMKYPESEKAPWQEQLSALHDGELSPAEAAALVRRSLTDESLLLQWQSMSTIGHVLREQQTFVSTQTLAQPILATVPQQEAANDGVFRWKMMAGVAALAAVGSLVWGLLGSVGEKSGAQNAAVMAQMQSTPAVNPSNPALMTVSGQVAGQEVTIIRDPRLDELLAAHKQFGGVSALQQPAGSLRSISLVNSRP